jgi:hypothetical protein
MGLMAGCCRARTQAQKYNDRWVICMGPRTCKHTGHTGKREWSRGQTRLLFCGLKQGGK